jgi:hypothetical protein
MRTRFVQSRQALLFLIVVALLLLIAPGAYAKIRTPGGGDLPIYARIEPGLVIHTDDWAAIVFYRPPECVPEDFNLLDVYDWPESDDDLGAFGCTPPTTDGFIIWSGEPGLSNPIQIKLWGLGAVPVWFVAWPELEAALDDGSLTVLELQAMASLLKGSASSYTETLHPDGVKVPMINLVALGILEDGRSFQVHFVFVTDGVMNVRIEFQ